MENRIVSLEQKVDKFSDLFNDVILNQQLIQKEISIMSKTLRKVEDMKLTQVECAANTNSRLKSLEDTVERQEEAHIHFVDEVTLKFANRDKIMAGFSTSVVVLLLGAVFTLLGGN